MDLAQSVAAIISLDANFVGKKPSELEVVKVLGPNSFANYQAGNVQGDLVHGYFVVTSGDDSAINRDTPILHATSNISIAFKVSGDWDVGSGDRVIDPIFIVASGTTPGAITSVTVAPAQKVVAAGTTAQLTSTVLPTGATQTVTWGSSNNAVATVSATGLVTIPGGATNGSTATITATSTVDATKKGTSSITVGTPVTGVSVTPTTGSVAVNGTLQLTATLTPTSPTISTVTWTSSNTSVATVSSTGLVTGVSAGPATITCTTTDGGFTSSSTITVTAAPSTAPSQTPTVMPSLPPAVGLDPVTVPSGLTLPSGIQKPSVETPTSGLPADVSSIVDVNSSTGRAYVKSSIMQSITSRMNGSSPVALPVFKGSVSATGGSAAFAFSLSNQAGRAVTTMRLVKVTGESAYREFSAVYASAALADGKFAIVTSAGTIRQPGEAIASTDSLVLVIKDNGGFDMDTRATIIVDPCFLVTAERGSSGGGGCNAGAFAPAVVLLMLPLLGFFIGGRR